MFDITTFNLKKYNSILAKGLSHGLGSRSNRVCIEAAICQTLGLPHGDDPECVAKSVRRFKIFLNDSYWSSPKARAEGLHDLGLAQLGSKDVVKDKEFSKLLAERTIRVLLPELFHEIFPTNEVCLKAAKRCELEGTRDAAADAADAADAAADAADDAADAADDAADAAAYAYAAAAAARAARAAAADAARAADAAAAAAAAARAVAAVAAADKYLILSAKLALDVLRELKSPGIALVDQKEA